MKTATHFRHAGRRYRLERRRDSANWYLVFQDAGRRHNHSTGCSSEAAARTQAQMMVEAIQERNAAALGVLLRHKGAQASTLSDLLDWWSEAAVQVSDQTRRSYANCLRSFLRRAGVDPATATTASLTGETARAYFRAGWVEAQKAGTSSDQNRLKRTWNSIARQAGGMFSPRHVEHMRDAGLVLPDLAEFRAALRSNEFRGCKKADWSAPDQATLDRTLAAWRATIEPDRNLYAAVWLMISCGLRKGEVAQARWDWVTERAGEVWLDGIGRFKDRCDRMQVRPIDPWWREGFAALTANGKPEGPILTGSHEETTDEVFRRVGGMLRGAGWQTQKTNHSLRALAGAWVAERWGIYAASRFLRHSTVTVTEQHYSHLVNAGAYTRPQTGSGIEWATSTPASQ